MPAPTSNIPSLTGAFDKLVDGIAGGIDALKSLLSFSQNARLLSLDLSSAGSISTSLVVERASGTEALDALDPFIVDALSSSAFLELKTLVGTEAGLGVVCADGSTRSWYGLVSRIAAMGADGGLARYRLWLSPWPVLLGLREDSYIFQDQTTLETAEALLADYPLARYEIRVADATRAALPKHAIRTQYRETDRVFLQRILAADGLSFWIEHDQDASTTNAGGALRHTLVITDEAHDWAAAQQATIRYHRLSATESEDAIHGFIATRQVCTNAVTRSGWNAQSVFAPSGDDEVAQPNDAIPQLEDHDGGRDAGRSDLGTDTAARIAHLRLLAHQLDAARFHGDSSVRTLAPGRIFTLTNHPDFGDDLVSAATGNSGFGSGLADARFKVVSVSHQMSNNLRTGLDDAASQTGGLGERGTYTNTFECVPAAVPVVPLPPQLPAAPGMLTALVVGVDGEGATTHRDHEVRIQFHFQRGVAPNPGGLTDTGWNGTNPDTGNAPGSEASGTWVRVSQALAGPDYGMVFVPRVGTEVLVAFEQGDLDRPIIVGSLHNGSDLPPFQAGVDSGVDHPGVIAGFHSKTLASPDAGGAGYNQLILDDTAGQLGAQLASSTQASQLNLGTLVRRTPGTATRGSNRGEGAELATDGWAVFRAGQGGLVSSTARSQAAGSQLDAQEALGQMTAAAALSQALSDAAEAQTAPKLTTPKDLSDFGTLIGTTVPAQAAKDPNLSIPAFAAPALFQETPARAALTSPASIAGFASQALHIVAQDQVHLSSGKTVELGSGTDTAFFTHSGGLTAIAANGPASIQAHTDQLKVLADQSVTVTSTAGKIEILADKKIVLRAGQGSITLDGGNITFAMPGLFSVKGSQQTLAGAGSDAVELSVLPQGALAIPNWIAIDYRDADGNPMANVGYKIKFDNGQVITGKLDQNGYAKHDNAPEHVSAVVTYDERIPKPEAPWDTLQKAAAAAQAKFSNTVVVSDTASTGT